MWADLLMTEQIHNIFNKMKKVEGAFFQDPLDTGSISLTLTKIPEELAALYALSNGFHVQYCIFYSFDAVLQDEDGLLQIGESTTDTVYFYDIDTQTYLEKDNESGDVFAEYNNLPDFLGYLLQDVLD